MSTCLAVRTTRPVTLLAVKQGQWILLKNDSASDKPDLRRPQAEVETFEGVVGKANGVNDQGALIQADESKPEGQLVSKAVILLEGSVGLPVSLARYIISASLLWRVPVT